MFKNDICHLLFIKTTLNLIIKTYIKLKWKNIFIMWNVWRHYPKGLSFSPELKEGNSTSANNLEVATPPEFNKG